MKRLPQIKIMLAVAVCFSMLLGSCSTALFSRSAFRSTERQISGSRRADPKIRESKKVRSAKKQQEKKQEKIKKDYGNYVKESRKRSYEIQSPDVKARMKKNEEQIKVREKNKNKRIKSESRGRARKFR